MLKKIFVVSFILIFIFISGINTVGAESIRMTIHSAGWDEGIQHFASQYEEDTGVEVIVEFLPTGEMRDRMTMEAVAGTGYFDIGYHSPGWFRDYYQYVKNLKPYIEKHGYEVDTHPEALVDGVMQHELRPDDYISLPLGLSTFILAYRSDFFEHPEEQADFQEKYGRELRPPESFREVYEVAEFFTRDAGETVAGEELEESLYGYADSMAHPNGSARAFINIVYSAGLDIFDENYEPDVEHEILTEATELFLDITENFMPPQVVNWEFWESVSYFSAGRAAMVPMISTGHTMTEAEDAVTAGKTGYTTFPKIEDNIADSDTGIPFLTSGGLLVFDTPNSEEAFKFLQYMLEENHREFMDMTGEFTRNVHFEDPDMMEKPWFEDWSEALLQQQENAFQRQGIEEFGSVSWQGTADFWTDILQGEISIEDAQARWAENIREEFERAGYYE